MIAIIWLWGTLLIAGFYPIIDGGFEQTLAVYRAWKDRSGHGKHEAESSTPASTESGVEERVDLAAERKL